ncbi:MAG: aminopeptidase P family protein [Myxococcales bacterium]|nr:aminopeptidase P family protein [Myxococcales bacterium]
MATPDFPHTDAELEGFKSSQRLSYDCVTHVEERLEQGMTELDACKMMDEYLRGQGITQYFHEPFAWFGDRSAFANDFGKAFAPSERALEPGMAVILDVAPSQNGYASDIGYAFGFGDTPEIDRMLDDLEPYRTLIAEGVRAGKTLAEIYRDVDALMAEQGYVNRHQEYPGEALGHLVGRLGEDPPGAKSMAGFGPAALGFLFEAGKAARENQGQGIPVWNGSPACDQRPVPGLWAVEPHLGKGDLGVKWEELLVVTADDAYWLDDDLPHVRRWKKD